MVEPVVCVPSAIGTMWSATAAADPPEEPPGVRATSCGLRVLPGWRLANSVVTVLPRRMPPALRVSATQAASRPARRPRWIDVPHSVGRSDVSMMSLTPNGTPASGPCTPARSRARAVARACAGSVWAKACTAASRAATRSRQAWTTASQVRRPARTAAAISLAVSALAAVSTLASTASIQLDVEAFDQWRPGVAGAADDCSGFLGGDRGGIEADLEKAVLQGGIADDLAQLAVERGHDLVRGPARREQHEVHASIEAGQSLLGRGRDVGHERRALLLDDGERLELAVLQQRIDRAGGEAAEVDARRDQIRGRLAAALVDDVR